ncbi:type II secretion system F family protein [Oleidesulfovibrio alaskensis]|jgi:tight adherence protein B|uniref:type II secretion system F family protein n=1 Tax=Oleidesulfovibrio alaskensis TaxID=58180 RepID=UPI0003FCC5C8|nr:type II secretion system F family protein [Oleidesulfovibrio alaskensis]MBL3581684.1 type II secretion system F family protein [Oleidesulfovibrio alaskensis]
MILIATLLAVAACFILVLGTGNLLSARRHEAKARVSRRLTALAVRHETAPPADIERRRAMSGMQWLDKVLSGRSVMRRLDLILEQGKTDINVGVIILAAVTLAAAGFAFIRLLTDNFWLCAVTPFAAGYLPFAWILSRRTRRMNRFHRQLPDALDLIARALKAGHAFPQGMRMVADEFADPVGPEFQITLDEINFGVSPDAALHAMTRRVDCADLRFFVVSVNIQRETGGNLAEIVSGIALLLRERFKLHGRVKVLSAEGRLTAWILFALPFGIGFIIHLLNPDFMSALYTTPEGNMLLNGSLFLMTAGALALKKLTTIRV